MRSDYFDNTILFEIVEKRKPSPERKMREFARGAVPVVLPGAITTMKASAGSRND